MASSLPTDQGSEPYADRRVHPRVPVALPAFIHVDGERHSAQILDLSSGGAKLNCPAGVLAGTAVILNCGTLAREAMVRWQNGPVLGLSFDCELDARELSELVDRSKALATRMKTRDS
jgi:hypothetical protein